MALPSVAPETHHGCPVARANASTVGCTVRRIEAGGLTPALAAIVSRAERTRVLTWTRSASSDAGSAMRTPAATAAGEPSGFAEATLDKSPPTGALPGAPEPAISFLPAALLPAGRWSLRPGTVPPPALRLAMLSTRRLGK